MCFRELSPSQLLSYPNPATSSPQIILPSPSLHFFAVRELGGLLCCLTGGDHKLSWMPGGFLCPSEPGCRTGMIPHPGCLAVCEMPRGGTQRGQICPHTACRKEERTGSEHPACPRSEGHDLSTQPGHGVGASPPPALREAFMSFSRAEALRLAML